MQLSRLAMGKQWRGARMVGGGGSGGGQRWRAYQRSAVAAMVVVGDSGAGGDGMWRRQWGSNSLRSI